MRKALLVAAREYNGAVRTRSFLIMVVVLPIMMGGGFIAIKLMEKGRDLSDQRLAVVDRTGRIGEAIIAAAQTRNQNWIHDSETGKQTLPAYCVELVPPDDADPRAQRVNLSDRIRRKELFAFVEIGPDVLHPKANSDSARIEYHSENAAMDDLRKWLNEPINQQIRLLRLKDIGIDQTRAARLFDYVPVEGLGLMAVDQTGQVQQAKPTSQGQAIGVPAAMMGLMLMLTIVGSSGMINVVLEEKMQRIAEVMLGSIRPFEFMLGKLVGMIGVSFTVTAIYLTVGLIAARYYGVMQYVPLQLVPWFLAYLMAAIIIFGSLMAALGAACNDMKEAQSLMLPVTLLMIVPTFIWFNVAREPLSGFSTAFSFIPPFTPMLMMIRLATPTAIPAWQPWAGLAGVIACAVLCAWIGGRVFRVGLLMQGKPPRLRDLIGWAFSD